MKVDNEKLVFGQVLKEIRSSREMSLRGLANVLGVSAVYLSDLEKNSRKVTLSVIEKIESNLILTEQEEETIMNAFTHDRLNIPVDLLYYLIDNNLLESIKTIQKEDENGESIKRLALTLTSKKTGPTNS